MPRGHREVAARHTGGVGSDAPDVSGERQLVADGAQLRGVQLDQHVTLGAGRAGEDAVDVGVGRRAGGFRRRSKRVICHAGVEVPAPAVSRRRPEASTAFISLIWRISVVCVVRAMACSLVPPSLSGAGGAGRSICLGRAAAPARARPRRGQGSGRAQRLWALGAGVDTMAGHGGGGDGGAAETDGVRGHGSFHGVRRDHHGRLRRGGRWWLDGGRPGRRGGRPTGDVVPAGLLPAFRGRSRARRGGLRARGLGPDAVVRLRPLERLWRTSTGLCPSCSCWWWLRPWRCSGCPVRRQPEAAARGHVLPLVLAALGAGADWWRPLSIGTILVPLVLSGVLFLVAGRQGAGEGAPRPPGRLAH